MCRETPRKALGAYGGSGTTADPGEIGLHALEESCGRSAHRAQHVAGAMWLLLEFVAGCARMAERVAYFLHGLSMGLSMLMSLC